MFIHYWQLLYDEFETLCIASENSRYKLLMTGTFSGLLWLLAWRLWSFSIRPVLRPRSERASLLNSKCVYILQLKLLVL